MRNVVKYSVFGVIILGLLISIWQITKDDGNSSDETASGNGNSLLARLAEKDESPLTVEALIKEGIIYTSNLPEGNNIRATDKKICLKNESDGLSIYADDSVNDITVEVDIKSNCVDFKSPEMRDAFYYNYNENDGIFYIGSYH